MALHTLLGGNGTIAQALYPLLLESGARVRLVSRSSPSVPGAESVAADMLDREAVMKAVAGSDVVYLLVGIAYDARVWKRDWPVIMQNVVDACKASRARLMFFDNAYMYGKQDGVITEETPYRPVSKKGEIRAGVARMLEREMQTGGLQAAIVRAVDFYGPGVTDKSAPGIFVFANLVKGRRAMWPVNADVPRSFNYVPDAAKAMVLLANDSRTWGETWHLPSVLPAPAGREFVRIAAGSLGTAGKVTVLPKWLLKAAGWFVPFMREAYEMLYQDEFAFRFSSEKFEKAFQFVPVSFEEGIRETARWFMKEKGNPG
ncbi:SDR family oxidoreductase [Ravibacter arvi]|uniref:SDR family oxidoreductase n=1 Tax=Ravibacter arvi TaxID=2051041 RepID=A0ABP8LVA3_9BACT